MYHKITNEQKAIVEKNISEFCKKHKIEFTRDCDLFEVCQQLGIKVLSMFMEDSIPGVDGLLLVNKNKKVIGVNNNLPLHQARFVIAHELSHYIRNDMSENKSDVFAAKDKLFHDEDKDIEEHIMDYMAASILVPKEEFNKDLERLSLQNVKTKEDVKNVSPDDIEYLAYRYNVESKLIRRRFLEV